MYSKVECRTKTSLVFKKVESEAVSKRKHKNEKVSDVGAKRYMNNANSDMESCLININNFGSIIGINNSKQPSSINSVYLREELVASGLP